ncbi:DUF4124 domain-containing protein [Sedimenticola thiotaurini]|uniref:DUF4124 domain-containing protein n=1 Tax=Sedimenticola thiotaurini TaxID=1543721 RepID=UPI0006998E05|nr:DUF4124 domain-containing protein [Sedimenticola thiotaurini]
MVIRLLLPLLLVVFWTGAADARMYRWVDENGTTVYSQSPPPSGKATEIKVQVAPPTPPDNASEKQTADDTPAESAADKPADGPTKAQIEESNRIKAENCAAARQNLEIYTNLGNRLIRTPDGLYKRLTEEERQQKIDESKAQVEEFCEK